MVELGSSYSMLDLKGGYKSCSVLTAVVSPSKIITFVGSSFGSS